MTSNREIIFTERPVGHLTANTFTFKDADVPVPEEGQVLLKTLYLSTDPYLRGVLRYAPIGAPISSGIVAKVIESKAAELNVGDIVVGNLPWRLINAAKATELRKVDPSWAPVSTALGILGMPGRTSYYGLTEINQLKEGETLLISGAAGAVGLGVVQLARAFYGDKIRIIGTASTSKIPILTKYGYDATIDYTLLKSVDEAREALKAVAPKGIDAYFDNTGGYVTDAAFDLFNKYARVAICGQISMYNDVAPPLVPNVLPKTIYKSITIRGFIQSDFAAKDNEFYEKVAPLVKNGTIKYEETFLEGFDKVPEALAGLFTGVNTGKLIVKI